MDEKNLILMCYIVVTALLLIGCSSEGNQSISVDEIALKEAKNIASEEGYNLKSETLKASDILIGDSEVFKLIKEASVEGGYLEADFETITENRKIIGYELSEKSKDDGTIMLCMVIDREKVIGAYLDYDGYSPSIAPIGDYNKKTAWNMEYIQGKDGEIVYCSNKNKDIYPEADIKNISCVLQETSITIRDNDTSESWIGSCKLIDKDAKSTIYEVRFDNNEVGYIAKSFTKYNDNTQHDTLIISYGEYSINLTTK